MKVQRTDAIIFDVDGTLWDTSDIVARSWSRAIRENSDLDISFTPEFLKAHAFGKPMDEIGRILLPDQSPEEIERLSQICFAYEDRAVIEEQAVIYEGVRETMERLRDMGLKRYIVSNCQKGYIEACMMQCHIEDLILDHLCFGDTLDKKSVTIRRLMSDNGLEHAIYVGDTRGDQLASAEAGIPFIYAAYGFGETEDPVYEIKDIRELPELMERINA